MQGREKFLKSHKRNKKHEWNPRFFKKKGKPTRKKKTHTHHLTSLPHTLPPGGKKKNRGKKKKKWGGGGCNYPPPPATVSTHPTHNSPLVQLVLLFATIYFSTTYHILCISGTRFEL